MGDMSIRTSHHINYKTECDETWYPGDNTKIFHTKKIGG